MCLFVIFGRLWRTWAELKDQPGRECSAAIARSLKIKSCAWHKRRRISRLLWIKAGGSVKQDEWNLLILLRVTDKETQRWLMDQCCSRSDWSSESEEMKTLLWSLSSDHQQNSDSSAVWDCIYTSYTHNLTPSQPHTFIPPYPHNLIALQPHTLMLSHSHTLTTSHLHNLIRS